MELINSSDDINVDDDGNLNIVLNSNFSHLVTPTKLNEIVAKNLIVLKALVKRFPDVAKHLNLQNKIKLGLSKIFGFK